MRAALVCVLVACGAAQGPGTPATPHVPELPSKGGPAWVEVTSEHFVLWTDAPVGRGRELVREMEHHRQVVLGIALGGAESRAKSFVIALRDAGEVAAYVPSQFIAYSWGSPTPVWQPIVIVAADTDDHDRHIFTHELTHVISFAVVPHQPTWFAEGLAGYFETAQISENRGTVDLGEPLDYIVARLRSQHPTPAATVFACNQHACEDDMFYATTWALFSFLVNNHPDQLQRYMQRLGELPKGQESQAWTEVFPDLPPDALDHALAAWLAHGRRMVLHFKLKVTDSTVTDRALTDADALATRALLQWLFSHDASKVQANLDAALAADPTNLVARLTEAATTVAVSVSAARATATAHPDDWRAWWLLGFAAQYGPDAREARTRMCALLAGGVPPGAPARLCEGVR